MNWTWLGLAAIAILIVLIVIGYRRGLVKELISMLFVLITLTIVWFVNPYVNQFLHENTSIDQKMEKNIGAFVQDQIAMDTDKGVDGEQGVIDQLPLPDNIKEALNKNNTSDVYRYLSVDSFGDYLTDYLTKAIVNGISFILSFVVASILVRILAFVLDILSHLPLIHGANKILGAMLGGVKGILFIWIALLILTVLCNTEIGKLGLDLVERDLFLSTVNRYNIFTKVFMSIFYGHA